jgi:hypothetical protein
VVKSRCTTQARHRHKHTHTHTLAHTHWHTHTHTHTHWHTIPTYYPYCVVKSRCTIRDGNTHRHTHTYTHTHSRHIPDTHTFPILSLLCGEEQVHKLQCDLEVCGGLHAFEGARVCTLTHIQLHDFACKLGTWGTAACVCDCLFAAVGGSECTTTD